MGDSQEIHFQSGFPKLLTAFVKLLPQLLRLLGQSLLRGQSGVSLRSKPLYFRSKLCDYSF